MLETSARLLRLLSLFQSRPDWSGPDLAERLGVTPRTVRRDVERLRRLGYPVHATPGVAGGYRLGAGAALPPLLLDDDEAVAVAVGLRTTASGGVAGIEESSLRALGKLEQVLPARLRHRVGALQAATVPLTGPGPSVDAGTLAAFAGACRDRMAVRFTYRAHDGTTSARHADPHHLVPTGRRWYLVAWDRAREDWRTYRLDRAGAPRVVGPRFVPREVPGADPAAFVSRAVTTSPYRHVARLRFAAPAAVVADRIGPVAGAVEPEGEDACLVTLGADHLTGIAAWLGQLGLEFTVLGPPELVEEMGRLAALLTRATRTGTAPDEGSPAGRVAPARPARPAGRGGPEYPVNPSNPVNPVNPVKPAGPPVRNS